jgi:hypothetical protein
MITRHGMFNETEHCKGEYDADAITNKKIQQTFETILRSGGGTE